MQKVYFFNTMNRRREEFKPLKSGQAGMYTCGPTVYNFAHIGNFRAYMFEDLLRRTLKLCGYNVTQIMNLTDVDDKTIRDSRAAGMSLDDFTAQYKKAFFEDLEKLNIEPAEHYPAATGHIPEMIELIRTLIDKGYAYESGDGCIYYSISKFPEYGKLAKIDMENQISGVRIKNDEYEKDAVADFALWKAWDKTDGDVWWDSPWGKGRPGWHIECSAMSMKYLGKTFDIHTGGIDNMFPHHEDEIAQSQAANGCTYVNYWLHCAHLIVNGEKMSKSAGNFFTLRQLLDKGYTGCEMRYVLLSTHYRKKLNFTFEGLDAARTTLKRIATLFERLREADGESDGSMPAIITEAKNNFTAALADDLNVSEAAAVIFGLQKEANKRLDSGTMSREDAEKTLDSFRLFDTVYGVFKVDEPGGDSIPPGVVELAERRQAARAAKNWGEADKLRDELKVGGYAVEDVPGGFRITKL